MATLEKIRSKSVLLFVIIIVALLAFILGDFLTSGRTYFGTGTTIASAAGKKVDYTHYQNEIEKATEQAQSYNNNVDNDELSQNVIRGLLTQQLLGQEYEDLGIRVSDNEISEAMTGAMIHPAAQQFIYTLSQQLGFDSMDGKAVLDAINNPQKYQIPVELGNQLKAAWAETEKEVEQSLLQRKFYGLIQGLFTANDLDAQSLYDDNSRTTHFAYVAKGYNTVPDEEAKVTEADIKAQWEKNKNLYRLDEETRAVDYIILYIEPSAADRLAGQKAVEDAVVALNATNGVDAVSSDSRFIVSHKTQNVGSITDSRLKDFLANAEDGQAEVISSGRDQYTIAKRISASQQVDSINVSVMGLRDAAIADSVMTALASGKAWGDFAETDNTQTQDSVWVTLTNATSISPSLKEAWLTAEIGKPVAHSDSIQGQQFTQIFKVNARRAPVTVYDYASIDYTVDPSNETLEKLNTDLRTFLSANSSGDDFSTNAAKEGYSLLSALVSASTPHIGSVPDSRGAVKWAMEASKGQVSPVIGDNKQSYLMAVAVKDIYNDGYKPWYSFDIRSSLENEALAAKKGAKLVADYTGKASDLAGYAKALDSEVAEGDMVFVSPRLATIGIEESDLQGAIAAAQQGKVLGPIAGNNAVVVFEVKSVDNEGRPFIKDEYVQRFNRTMGLGTVDPFRLLLGKNKMQNNSLEFIQSAVN